MIAPENIDEMDLWATADTGASMDGVWRRERAIAAVAGGGAVLMLDDPKCPTRVDIVRAAVDIGTDDMAFVIRHTDGFVQVAVPTSRCFELDIVHQRGVLDGTAQQRVTIDAAEGIGTGISAADRATTARALASGTAGPGSFTRPGHVVPLAVDIDARTHTFGHAEASTALVRAAAMGEYAVLSTITEFPASVGVGATAKCSALARYFSLPVAIGTCSPGGRRAFRRSLRSTCHSAVSRCSSSRSVASVWWSET